MKNSQIAIAVVVLVILGILIFVWSRKNAEVENIPTVSEQLSVRGCYAVRYAKDVYTLNVESQTGENVSGNLAFKNFEKDSSSGTFQGTYRNGILFGDYTFQSEGTQSLMQVIFKKSGDNFIRGYGSLDASGARFADLSDINYDASSPLAVFKKGECGSVNLGAQAGAQEDSLLQNNVDQVGK